MNKSLAIISCLVLSLSGSQALPAQEAPNSTFLSIHKEVDRPVSDLSIHKIASTGSSSSSIPELKPAQLPLTTRSTKLASQIGILHLVKELYEAKYEETDFKTPLERKIALLHIRRKISDQMRHSLLQIQDAIAAIEWDLAHTLRLYDYLSNKKSKYDQITNVITFATTGVITVMNGAFGYMSGNGGLNSVNITGIGSGLTSTLLPTLSFRRHKYANPDASTEDPNMLAQIFDRKTDERTKYHDLIWQHLNSTDPHSKDNSTRRQRVLKEWMRLRDVKELSKQDIGLVTGTAPKGEKISLSILDTRADLLTDLRAEIADYYRDLAQLQSELIAI